MTLSRPTDAVQKVTANGLELAYLEEGSGPLVLCIHGFPDTPHTWDHVRPRIAAKGYRVVTPWTRGYAPSAIPARDADDVTLATDVLELIRALGETSAVLVGHDWGASAVYGAASLGPERVSKLFTVAIPHPASLVPTPMNLWRVRHFLAYKLRGAPARFAANDFAALPAIYKRWSPAWSPPPEEFAAVRECFTNPASLDAAFGYYRQLKFTMPPFLKTKIRVPTVSFAGLDDPNIQPAAYEKARKMFSGSYAVETMRGGHFMHREAPEEFATKLLAHL